MPCRGFSQFPAGAAERRCTCGTLTLVSSAVSSLEGRSTEPMKAMQYEGYGGPDKLRCADVPRPEPGAAQLLVRVAAASVNPVDWKLHDGTYRWVLPMRFPSTPGFDLAGEVVAVGANVRRFKPGERVYAMSDIRPGRASAEYVVIGEAAAARPPANLSAREAAALALAGLTALQCLRDLGRLRAGQRVLVIGASGGVGHLAVQIAKAYGAHVTGVCSTRHVALVRGLGAERVVDYTREPSFLAPGAYDVILDLIVREPIRALLAALTTSGVYVSTLPSLMRVAAALILPAISKKRVRVVSVKPRGRDLDELRRLCEAGALRPVIDKTFRLEDLAAAHAYSRQGKTTGKIAVDVAVVPSGFPLSRE